MTSNVVTTVVRRTSSYDGERKLEDNFIKVLNGIIANGGRVISIVQDETRYKKAYVEVHPAYV